MKVLICAGGTGGGIYPALAAASELLKMGLDNEQICWIGTRGEMEEKLVPRAGLSLETISGGAIVGVPPQKMLMNGFKLTWGIGQARRLMRRFRPAVVFLTGGYVAVPVTIAARMQEVPVVVYLPDVEPGSAIRFSLRQARKVACTTQGSEAFVPAEKMVVTGYPVRPQLRRAAQLDLREALATFNLEPGRRTLFVFGGSRGARSINRALMSILPELLSEMQIIHISGNLTWPEVAANVETLTAEQRAYYRPYPYLHEEMGAAFRVADLVVARAGASMLGESPAFALPAVLVPYPHAWRYQRVNAEYLVEHGAAVHLADERLPDELLPIIKGLMRDESRLTQMSAAAASLDRPEATAQLARLIMDVGQSAAQGVTA